MGSQVLHSQACHPSILIQCAAGGSGTRKIPNGSVLSNHRKTSDRRTRNTAVSGRDALTNRQAPLSLDGCRRRTTSIVFLLSSLDSHICAPSIFTCNYGGSVQKITSWSPQSNVILYRESYQGTRPCFSALYAAQGTTSDHHCPKPMLLNSLTSDIG